MHQETPHWPSPDISGRFSAMHILFPIQSQQCIQQGKHRQPYFKSKAAGADTNRIYPKKQNPNPFPIGKEFGLFMHGGACLPQTLPETSTTIWNLSNQAKVSGNYLTNFFSCVFLRILPNYRKKTAVGIFIIVLLTIDKFQTSPIILHNRF